jgi:hypothetical protein
VGTGNEGRARWPAHRASNALGIDMACRRAAALTGARTTLELSVPGAAGPEASMPAKSSRLMDSMRYISLVEPSSIWGGSGQGAGGRRGVKTGTGRQR